MTSGPGPWRRLRSHRRLRPARAKVLGSKASTEPSFAFLSARSSHASISRNDHRGTCTWATENRRRFSKVLVLRVLPRARPSCAEPTFLSCSRTAMRCAYPPARLAATTTAPYAMSADFAMRKDTTSAVCSLAPPRSLAGTPVCLSNSQRSTS